MFLLKIPSAALAALALASLFICPAAPVAQAAQVKPAEAFAKVLSGQEEELVGAAEAMPADKYNFAPATGEFKGVRTFGKQMTHIAQAQYFFFGGFGVKPPIDPKSLEGLTGKDEIVKALKDSFAFAHQAVETITPQNAFEQISDRDGTNTRATITAFSLAHTNDHYGQIIEYLRMNNIVPPASR